MQFAAFNINISRKNIIQNHVFNKIRPVKLFIIRLLDLVKRYGNNIRIMLT